MKSSYTANVACTGPLRTSSARIAGAPPYTTSTSFALYFSSLSGFSHGGSGHKSDRVKLYGMHAVDTTPFVSKYFHASDG